VTMSKLHAPNPHCECANAGYCTRHQINKSHYHFQCCKGVSGAADCGEKMWRAWELERLGAELRSGVVPMLDSDWPCSNSDLLNPLGPHPLKKTSIPQETQQQKKEALEKKLHESPVGLPGTRVKYLIMTDWKQHARKNCACDARARQMDELGCDGCREKIDTCVEWLMEGAAERHWIRPVVALLSEDRTWMKFLSLHTDRDITPQQVARSLIDKAINIERERVG